jgi:hypothetical protein
MHINWIGGVLVRYSRYIDQGQPGGTVEIVECYIHYTEQYSGRTDENGS